MCETFSLFLNISFVQREFNENRYLTENRKFLIHTKKKKRKKEKHQDSCNRSISIMFSFILKLETLGRQQLSAELGLNEAQIKIWFQNKRYAKSI